MITASIVTYIKEKNADKKNELRTVVRCVLSSIIDRLFIIDNSPTDALKNIEELQADKVTYIHNNRNLGYGTAHNIALKQAINLKSDYHLVLNPDIFFEKDVIDALKKYMDDNEDVGSVMPKVVYPNGEIQYLCKLQPGPVDLFGRRFLPPKLMESRNYKYELRQYEYNRLLNVPCLSGCFMFLRTKVLEDIGLFDESFFLYFEDVDMYRRIHKKYKTIFFPDVTIVHSHERKSYKSKKLLFIHIKSAIRFFNKYGWFFDKERKEINKKVHL